MESTVWERILSHGRLSPTQTERAVAPERVLKRVNSGCRKGCSKGGGISQISTILYNDMLFLYWPNMQKL